MRRSPHRRAVAALTAAVLTTGGAAACSSGDGPADVLGDLAAGWRSGDLDPVGFVSPAGTALRSRDVLGELRVLTGDLTTAPLTVAAAGEPTVTGEVATGALALDWTLPGGAHWAYRSPVQLTRRGSDGWRVVWQPSVVQERLTAGDVLRVRRTPATRGAVLGGTGEPLVTPRPVVTVGVSPEKVTDFAALAAKLGAALRTVGVDLDAGDLKSRVDSAAPGAFVDVVTLRRADYDRIRDEVRPLPGTVFRDERRDLAPSRAFARATLGTVGPATRDDVAARPDAVAAGDQVGHGGLQQRYDDRLRGAAGRTVVAAGKTPDGEVEDTTLFTVAPTAGRPVKVSLDAAVQGAADKAVAAEKRPSALVALRVRDAAVLAVANGPDGGTVDTALGGRVPPGSTFKTVSAYGLLQKKAVTADTPVDCPKTATVAGREFRNAGGEVLGRVPFRVDFAKSCNTAFVGLAPKLGADGLAAAAAALGVGQPWDPGTGAFTGTVSAAGTPTELAAAVFGQGATAVSPVAMAGVAAAVAKGGFQPPRLVLDPAPPAAAAVPPLDAAAVGPLRTMMREVVTAGTATALEDVPGAPVHGKTGTAEFATGDETTHAWFIGWRGDVAFAVMVQKGGAGADAAVPIVERFLRSLPD